MARPDHRGRRRALGAALILLAAIGCGRGGATVPPVEAEQARQALRVALDAWKAGEPYDALAKRSPPVRVIDEDWLAGLKLESYEVGARDRALGPTLRCPVTLRLRDRAGKSIRKLVAFDVATGPSPSVIRQD